MKFNFFHLIGISCLILSSCNNEDEALENQNITGGNQNATGNPSREENNQNKDYIEFEIKNPQAGKYYSDINSKNYNIFVYSLNQANPTIATEEIYLKEIDMTLLIISSEQKCNTSIDGPNCDWFGNRKDNHFYYNKENINESFFHYMKTQKIPFLAVKGNQPRIFERGSLNKNNDKREVYLVDTINNNIYKIGILNHGETSESDMIEICNEEYIDTCTSSFSIAESRTHKKTIRYPFLDKNGHIDYKEEVVPEYIIKHKITILKDNKNIAFDFTDILNERTIL